MGRPEINDSYQWLSLKDRQRAEIGVMGDDDSALSCRHPQDVHIGRALQTVLYNVEYIEPNPRR